MMARLLPLNDSLIPPKLSRLIPNILDRQQHRCLRPLIRRLRSISLCHIRIHIPGTARIHEPLTPTLLLLPRQRLCTANTTRLAYRIRRARESCVLLSTLVDRGGEVLQDSGDVVFSLSLEKAIAHGGGVLRQRARGGSDVYDTASGLQSLEECATGQHCVVVVRVQGLLDDVGVEAIQRDAGVVDYEIDALSVRLLEVLCEVGNAGLVCDV